MAEKGTRKNTGKKKTAKRGRPKSKPAAVSRRDILTEKQEAFLYYLVYHIQMKKSSTYFKIFNFFINKT